MRIYTLTLNPAFDIHASLASLDLHAENFATVTDRDAGGKGVNISRALHAVGLEDTALIAVGEENGEEFCRALEADGLLYHAFPLAGRIRENLTVHEENAPETRISFGGLSADDTLLSAMEDYLAPRVAAGDILAVVGRLPSGLCMRQVLATLSRLQSRGMRLVIDSRSFTAEEVLSLSPFLIKPNEEEAVAYFGKSPCDLGEAKEAAKALHRAGVENVMLSLGGRGALLVAEEGAFLATPPTVSAISTVGAGDSSIAGFLFALSEGKDKKEALATAVAFGTAACLRSGTRPPQAADIARILATVRVEDI
jgi:1-phosphofructokinase family hexose kinase